MDDIGSELSAKNIVVIEATEIAGGSSGKAGGLLASWATPSCLAPLSFELHAELAEKYNGILEWVIVVFTAPISPTIRKHAEGEEIGPIVGGVPGVTGLWVATGHDEWGVQNSLGTGKILAGMVMRDELEGVDVKALDPRNFIRE
ncbi:hypothetical protein DID88_007061 [Monilinia fructigena]|uniref:FAD dependent oxidoreductase domain-containing protein n=1 Tax=Monilinia fructigena TaxID=38457 RepID=A0A395J7M1_9HELO|nr:hypothetical protein DID88_007061 [Monilinia fructigena]